MTKCLLCLDTMLPGKTLTFDYWYHEEYENSVCNNAIVHDVRFIKLDNYIVSIHAWIVFINDESK